MRSYPIIIVRNNVVTRDGVIIAGGREYYAIPIVRDDVVRSNIVVTAKIINIYATTVVV